MDFNRSSSHGCPCKHCPEKGCGAKHDTCEQYIAWRKTVDARNEATKAYNESSDVMSTAKKRRIWKDNRYSRQNTFRNSNKA